MVQRSDGVNVFIFFNKQAGRSASDFYNDELKTELNAMNDSDWPTTDIGGFWIDPVGSVEYQFGSYDHPFVGMIDALYFLADGSRVNFHPGTSNWTGTISTKLLLRAPLGTVTIGAAY